MKILPIGRLGIEEIAEKEGASIHDLESRVTERLRIQKGVVPYSAEDDFIEMLYGLYFCSQENENLDRLPWLNAMRSLNGFIGHFYPDMPLRELKPIIRRIDAFSQQVVHPQRLTEIDPHNRLHRYRRKGGEIIGREVYHSAGEWVALPTYLQKGSDLLFATKDVLDEARRLFKSDYNAPDFSHVCNSSALNGIARHKALLNPRELLQIGEEVVSGVFQFEKRSFDPDPSEAEGVVCAFKGNPSSNGYAILKWFDEYPIAFGVNRERQRDFLRTLDREISYWHPEIRLGPTVPLTSVDYVYGIMPREKRLEKWRSVNCPHAKLVSLEAAQLLDLTKRRELELFLSA